jgi:Winged helix-turn-helix DNA-binding
MSLLDQARELEGQLVERLNELEPLIAEYNQLRQLAERLGVSYTPPGESAGAAALASRGTGKKSAGRRSPAKPRGVKRASTKRAAKRTSPTRPARTTSARSARKTTSAKATPPRSSTAKPTARRRSARKAGGTRPGQRSEDVLRVIGEQPGISVREIGERLGVDATGLYRVTNKLTADGRLRKDGTKLYVIQTDAGGPSKTVEEPAESPGAARSAGARSDGSSGDESTSST